jgi:hypothetical protein
VTLLVGMVLADEWEVVRRYTIAESLTNCQACGD